MLMRANGWSLGKISENLKIPRSTLFEWGGELQKEIHFVKCFQIEKLQEKYLPSFEEELQQLSGYLARVERALQNHQFEEMRPEFLLHTALQLRSRLNQLRTDVPMHVPLEQVGLQPLSVSACISRLPSEVPAATDEALPAADKAEPSPKQINDHPANIILRNGSTNGKSNHQNRTNPDKNPAPQDLQASRSATCNESNNAPVRFLAIPERGHPCPRESSNGGRPTSRPGSETASPAEENRTNPDKNEAPENPEPSPSRTSNEHN